MTPEPLTMSLTRLQNAADYCVHVMAKPTGAICNLDCEYCFFLSKETLYPVSPFRMQDIEMEPPTQCWAACTLDEVRIVVVHQPPIR